MTKRRVHAEPRVFWRPAEEAMLAVQYPHMKTAVIAAMLGRSLSTVYQRAQRLGLSKSPEYLASPAACRLRRDDDIGAPYRFPKGHVPANKGLRRPGWAPGRMRETQFKPGVRQGVAVKLYKPIGTLRVTKDGYLSRKVNDGMPLQRRWRLEHLIVWEAANGSVPKGHAITFKDGNKRHIALDNLECISRRELMLRNTLHRYPEPIPQLIQLRGAIQRQINRREHGKQDRGLEGSPVRNARGAPRSGKTHGDRARQGRGRSGEGDRG